MPEVPGGPTTPDGNVTGDPPTGGSGHKEPPVIEGEGGGPANPLGGGAGGGAQRKTDLSYALTGVAIIGGALMGAGALIFTVPGGQVLGGAIAGAGFGLAVGAGLAFVYMGGMNMYNASGASGAGAGAAASSSASGSSAASTIREVVVNVPRLQSVVSVAGAVRSSGGLDSMPSQYRAIVVTLAAAAEEQARTLVDLRAGKVTFRSARMRLGAADMLYEGAMRALLALAEHELVRLLDEPEGCPPEIFSGLHAGHANADQAIGEGLRRLGLADNLADDAILAIQAEREALRLKPLPTTDVWDALRRIETVQSDKIAAGIRQRWTGLPTAR